MVNCKPPDLEMKRWLRYVILKAFLRLHSRFGCNVQWMTL